MPEVKGLLHDDMENAKSEDEMLEDNGTDVDSGLGQPEHRLGAPKTDDSLVGTVKSPVDPNYSSINQGDEPDQLGNETGLNGDTPYAGDVDPDSTRSAEETGQDGDPTEPKKSHGHPWDH